MDILPHQPPPDSRLDDLLNTFSKAFKTSNPEVEAMISAILNSPHARNRFLALQINPEHPFGRDFTSSEFYEFSTSDYEKLRHHSLLLFQKINIKKDTQERSVSLLYAHGLEICVEATFLTRNEALLYPDMLQSYASRRRTTRH